VRGLRFAPASVGPRSDSWYNERVNRRANNTVTAISFAMFLAVTAVLARSFWDCDDFTHSSWEVRERKYHLYSFSWYRGRFIVDRERSLPLDEPLHERLRAQSSGNWAYFSDRCPGPLDPDYDFALWSFDRGVRGTNLFVEFAVLLAVRPVIWIGRRVRRKQSPGHCSQCGYDLRATPNRCPECGTAPIPISVKLSD